MKTTNEKKNISADRLLMISCLSAVLALAGCQQEDTAEKAEQKIDHAAEKAEQNIEHTTEKANQKIDAAKESLDQNADSAKDYIDESTDASKGELEKERQKIDRAAENAKQEIGQATAVQLAYGDGCLWRGGWMEFAPFQLLQLVQD